MRGEGRGMGTTSFWTLLPPLVAFLPPPLTVTLEWHDMSNTYMPSAVNRRGNVREFHIVWRVVALPVNKSFMYVVIKPIICTECCS